LAGLALAQAPDLGLQQASSIGLGTRDIRETIGLIIRAFMGLLGIIAVCLILYAGFIWMTAAGAEEKVQRAKRILVNATIGLVIILAAYAITLFIFNALGVGQLNGEGGDCPSGNCSASGGGLSSGGTAMLVTAIAPAGTGPGAEGWPRNYAIRVAFSQPVEPNSVNTTSFVVRRCNARDGEFDVTRCEAAPLPGETTVSGREISFRPSGQEGDNPNYFPADYWYLVRVVAGGAGGVKSTGGVPLTCLLENPANLAKTDGSASGYCARAAAFGNRVDVEVPAVNIVSPTSSPALCQGATSPVPVIADARDDFSVFGVAFWLDGNLTDAFVPMETPAVDYNDSSSSAYRAQRYRLDASLLSPGNHRIAAQSSDPGGLTSSTVERTLRVTPGHCCNGVQDGDETGKDCGGACGSCDGSACGSDADCAGGFCNLETKLCESRPLVSQFLPGTGAGAGSVITLRGTHLGTVPGRVVFLGGEGDGDDVSVSSCNDAAWKDDEVKVQVPDGAKTGAIRVTTAAGASDATDDDFGPNLGAFPVTAELKPGICWLEPSTGLVGTPVLLHGTAFGSSQGTSSLFFGPYVLNPTADGWSDTVISATIPPGPSGNYDVAVRVAANESNRSNYLLGEAGAVTAPRVTAVIPESGPPGTYVTVIGSGFGWQKGTVKFKIGDTDVALGAATACGDTWQDDYVVVKMPELYGTDAAPAGAVQMLRHAVVVETAAPTRSSNDDVGFTVTTGLPAAGLCAISPLSGPPGTNIELRGEGFGRVETGYVFAVDFSKGTAGRCLLDLGTTCPTLGEDCAGGKGECVREPWRQSASSWNPGLVTTVVPGERPDKETWPVSGPVRLVARDVMSGNAIPFKVQDCKEGAACPVGTICCSTGACATSCVSAARTSAYGWLMSTEVIPSLPQVVERALCTDFSQQSPSPQKDQRDACLEAAVRVEFTRYLNTASLNTDTFRVESCGTDAAPAADCTPVSWNTPSWSWTDCDGTSVTTCKALYANPRLAASTWYRVTLVSNPAGSPAAGLHEPGADGRYLDGDFDNREGGDYSYTFRTRTDSGSCSVTATAVDPSTQVIRQPLVPVPFSLVALHNCGPLQCTTSAPPAFSVSWSSPGAFLGLDLPASPTPCGKPVLGLAETPAGTPTTLSGAATVAGEGSKSSSSTVTVKYADPRVMRVSPVGSCLGACVNTAVYAQFNIPMDRAPLEKPGNVQLWRCRNSTCNPPYDTQTPGDPPADCRAVAEQGDADKAEPGQFSRVKLVCSDLKPSTFYAVRVTGGEGGVSSSTGGLLTGASDGTDYVWTFRTKDIPQEKCRIDSLSVEPSSAVLRYVGARVGLSVSARGPKDECGPEGQELNAWPYSWSWLVDGPNPVLAGFVSGSSGIPGLRLVDTNPVPAAGCTGQCVNSGSTVVLHQCGDGRLDNRPVKEGPSAVGSESCERTDETSAWCTTSCLLKGTATPTCGDGELDLGENCEAVVDEFGVSVPSGTLVFPKGCKKPGDQVEGYADAIGCLLLGSKSGGATCGDGYLGDGEECDDSNASNGDGCSRDCLFEGSLPSCASNTGGACVNVCGNGKAEPGEDTGCEPNPGAAGCNPKTCLHLGLAKCAPGQSDKCCGNGKAEPGEDAACETDPRGGEFCTDRCVLKGSNYTYSRASFCSDAVSYDSAQGTGLGETVACETSELDGLVDPLQVVEGEPQPPLFKPGTPDGMTSKVTVSTEGANAASAAVSLDCSCNKAGNTTAERDAYCSQYVSPGMPDQIGCDQSGCCRLRPNIVSAEPSGELCRNGVITLTFDQEMDAASVVQAVSVGADSGVAAGDPDAATACKDGTQAVSQSPRPSLVARLWHGLVSLVRSLLGLPAGAVSPAAPPDHVFCIVAAKVDVAYSADRRFTYVRISPTAAYPSDKWLRVRVTDVARSKEGVAAVTDQGIWHFAVSKDMCTFDRIAVSPDSLLIADSENPDYPVVAKALDGHGREIAPTADYDWEWHWQLAPEGKPYVIVPRLDAQTGAQLGLASLHARNPKLGDSPKDFVPKNGSGTILVEALPNPEATGTVSSTKQGAGLVTVLLCRYPWPRTYECGAGGSVTLPWKNASQSCSAGPVWEPYGDPDNGLSFYFCRDAADASGNIVAGLPAFKERPSAVFPGRDILKEYLFTFDPAEPPYRPGADFADDAIGLRVNSNLGHVGILPWYRSKGFEGEPEGITVAGYDGLREGRTAYFATTFLLPTSDNRVYTNVVTLTYSDGAAKQTTDVVGQMLANMDVNYKIVEEASCKAGAGAPTQVKDRYLLCSRDEDCWTDASGTVLVPREARYACDQSAGFCGVKCEEDRDCWLDPSGNEKSSYKSRRWCDTASHSCRLKPNAAAPKNPDQPAAYETGVGRPVACSEDLTCRRDAAGALQASRVSYTCTAPKAKLARDARRWADLLSMRAYLVGYLTKTGTVPRLSSGTFVTTMTVSKWPSWDEFLFPVLGAALASDPINQFGSCPEGADPQTCWNKDSQAYQCPLGSHVYEYRGVGGEDFALRADLETAGVTWTGKNCPERSVAACAWLDGVNKAVLDADCRVSGGRCTYAFGSIELGNATGPLTCVGSSMGAGKQCGDGLVDPATEQCELGDQTSVSCCEWGSPASRQSAEGSCSGRGPDARVGRLAKACTKDCHGFDAVGKCVTGYCGDGAVQAPELCDDGPLNGKYGYCKADCSGTGLQCGDGLRQPGETCDCGVKNGQYAFNGILSAATDTRTGSARCGLTSTNVATCSWDCRVAGPRCGDAVVNGEEKCDGGFQQFKGYCDDAAKTGCDADGDCPAGTCSEDNRCTNAPTRSCQADGDCRLACSHFCPTVEQSRRRSCLSNDPASSTDDTGSGKACTWGSWICTAPGSCGNGKKESGEQCDDGNSNNNDACVIDEVKGVMCKTNVCGDGYVNYVGGEECDNGPLNGQPTANPEYGFTANYCTSKCQLATVTGGFCGDGLLQNKDFNPAGPEQCDREQGLKDYVCVSQRPVDQAIGAVAGATACGSACQLGCADPNARPCLNLAMKDDGGNVTNNHDSADEAARDLPPLYDECDPDDDNDGQPDIYDCDDFNPERHGSYTPAGILALPEYCDGTDNNCDYQVDNDWVLDAKPGTPKLRLKGTVVDAFFPTFAREEVKVRIDRKICTGDKTTPCNSDKECKDASLGTCGIETLSEVTGADGRYDFSGTGIRWPSESNPTCKMKIQVDSVETFADINNPFWPGKVDPLESRKLGYFEAKLDVDPKLCDNQADCTLDEKVYWIPRPPAGNVVAAFEWDKALSYYLDAWLKKAGTGYTVNPVGYTNQAQHHLYDYCSYDDAGSPLNGSQCVMGQDAAYCPGGGDCASGNPWARVICKSSDAGGDPTSCNNFSEAPEITIFNTATGPGYALQSGDKHQFVIHAFQCADSNCAARFVDPDANARVYVAFTNPSHCDETSGNKYGTGCLGDVDCGSGKCRIYDFCGGGSANDGKRCSEATALADCPGSSLEGPCFFGSLALNDGAPVKASLKVCQQNRAVSCVDDNGCPGVGPCIDSKDSGAKGKYWNVFSWNWLGDHWSPEINNRFTDNPPFKP
jgi:cysteine-rich repeat protein